LSADPLAPPAGIPGSALSGPWPVGAYAAKLRDELRKRARLQLFGEVWNLRVTRVKVWFELRDASGALPCAMWRDDFEQLGLVPGALADGSQVVVAGGPDYYPGSRTASPAFSFSVTDLRVAGEGDLLAQLDRLRKLLAARGSSRRRRRSSCRRCRGRSAWSPPRAARRATTCSPACSGAAGPGRLVWAFAPVQDRTRRPRSPRCCRTSRRPARST
jgi:exodeoxyribonuclease VII large subunit